jgi:hypothetical protein
LPLLARKRHPLANDGASCLQRGHPDFLSRLSDDPAARYAACWTG